MNRITEKMLQNKIDYLNRLTGSPVDNWTRDEEGMHSSIDNFHLSCAYGGVALYRTMNIHGGIHDIFSGHMPKRELFDRIDAYIDGINL